MMIGDDNDGQMIFGDLVGLKLPDICQEPQLNLTQETCPNRESNPGPLHDRHSCYHLVHSGGQISSAYHIVIKNASLFKYTSMLLDFTALFNILGHQRRFRDRAWKVRQILLRGSNFGLRFFYVP